MFSSYMVIFCGYPMVVRLYPLKTLTEEARVKMREFDTSWSFSLFGLVFNITSPHAVAFKTVVTAITSTFNMHPSIQMKDPKLMPTEIKRHDRVCSN